MSDVARFEIRCASGPKTLTATAGTFYNASTICEALNKRDKGILSYEIVDTHDCGDPNCIALTTRYECTTIVETMGEAGARRLAERASEFSLCHGHDPAAHWCTPTVCKVSERASEREHAAANADAPICPNCGTSLHFYTVGAPGIGRGYLCDTCDYVNEIVPTRILTIEDVR